MIANTEKDTSSSAERVPMFQATSTPRSSRIRVWLTDDNALFRNSLAELLARVGNFDCELQFNSAESLLEGLARESAPDVILLDVEMGGMTGVDALRPIRALAPEVRVLIVTSFFDPLYDAQSRRDGASAFLLKAYAPQNLAGEIHRALASPVCLAELAEVKSRPGAGPASSAGPAGRNLFARLASWTTGISTALFGQLEYHRPATTPK